MLGIFQDGVRRVGQQSQLSDDQVDKSLRNPQILRCPIIMILQLIKYLCTNKVIFIIGL
jgi:hypothetical protein